MLVYAGAVTINKNKTAGVKTEQKKGGGLNFNDSHWFFGIQAENHVPRLR